MFVFHFTVFNNQLIIQGPDDKNIPIDSPVLINYRQKENLSKHEILKRFYNIILKAEIDYLKPNGSILEEWNFDLDLFKNTFEILSGAGYFKGSITIEPTFDKTSRENKNTGEFTWDTSLKFSIKPEEVKILSSHSIPQKKRIIT